MSVEANPETLAAVASALRNAGTDVEARAGEPPIPNAGEVTDVIEAALRLICEGIGNMSASVSGVGDAVADGQKLYVDTDYEAALELEASQPRAENPN